MANPLGDLKELGLSKAMQKQINRIPAAQLESMMQRYGGLGLGAEQKAPREMTARERLRAKIRESDIGRMGKFEREQMRKRQEQREMQQLQQRMEQQGPELTAEERAAKDRARLKRLQKRYKTVSEETYFDALEQLKLLKAQQGDSKNAKNTQDQQNKVNKYQGLIDLYHHQHRNDEEAAPREIELDLSGDSD